MIFFAFGFVVTLQFIGKRLRMKSGALHFPTS